jgi:hypothetical protein
VLTGSFYCSYRHKVAISPLRIALPRRPRHNRAASLTSSDFALSRLLYERSVAEAVQQITVSHDACFALWHSRERVVSVSLNKLVRCFRVHSFQSCRSVRVPPLASTYEASSSFPSFSVILCPVHAVCCALTSHKFLHRGSDFGFGTAASKDTIATHTSTRHKTQHCLSPYWTTSAVTSYLAQRTSIRVYLRSHGSSAPISVLFRTVL